MWFLSLRGNIHSGWAVDAPSMHFTRKPAPLKEAGSLTISLHENDGTDNGRRAMRFAARAAKTIATAASACFEIGRIDVDRHFELARAAPMRTACGARGPRSVQIRPPARLSGQGFGVTELVTSSRRCAGAIKASIRIGGSTAARCTPDQSGGW